MLKHFFWVIIGSMMCSVAFAVEDIYVTDTLKCLPADMQAKECYLSALRQKKLQHNDSAMALLRKSLQLDSTNGAVYMDLSNLSISANNADDALYYMSKAYQYEPDNYWISRAYALLLAQSGNFSGAISIYEKLVDENPQKVENVETLANLYTQTRQYDKALAQWRLYEKESGMTDQTTIEKVQILADKGDRKGAIAALDTLINSNRQNCKYPLLKANVLALMNENKKAEKLYKQLASHYSDCYIQDQNQLMQFYMNTRQNKKALALYRQILRDEKIDFETKRSLIVIAAQDSALAPYVGENDYKTLVQQYPGTEGAYLLIANYYMSQNDQRAISYVQSAVKLNPHNPSSWMILMDYYSATDSAKYEKAVGDALANNPDNGVFLFQQGSIDLLKEHDSEAMKHWQQSAAILSHDKHESFRTSVVYGLIGDLYMKQAKVDSACTAYDESLRFNPDNLSVLNNYAYALADNNIDFVKAEQMSGRTVATSPNNRTFLDTYAWVYFKQGNYSMAELYIEQAYDAGGFADPEVIEHFGDILYMKGETIKGLSYWKLALSKSPDPSEILKKKVETKSYIEK